MGAKDKDCEIIDHRPYALMQSEHDGIFDTDFFALFV